MCNLNAKVHLELEFLNKNPSIKRLKNTVFSPIEVTKLTLDWSSMDLDVVDSLLLYIYTGRVNRSNLLGLKSAGDFFDIGDLKKLIDGELEQGNAARKTNSDCLKVKWKSNAPMRSITNYKCRFCHFKVSLYFMTFFILLLL